MMKKIFIVLFVLTISFSISACGNHFTKPKKESPKQTDEFLETKKFTDTEIEDAKKVVLKEFEESLGQDCKLIDLYYAGDDDNRADNIIKNNLDGVLQSKNIKEEDMIVFYCDFKVNAKRKNRALTPNEKHTGYSWLLIRDNPSGEWEIVNRGY